MKKIVIVLFFVLMVCDFSFAQEPPADFFKVRQIKPLESTREDVKRILNGFKSDIDEEKTEKAEPIFSETFSRNGTDIEVFYSSGTCSSESDDKWNVPKGKVTQIEIPLNDIVKMQDSFFDFSNFRKEQQFTDIEDLFIYHDKSSGIAFEVDNEKIKKIHLFPTNSYYSFLCENKKAEEYKEFYSTDSWFGNTKLEDRIRVPSCGLSSLSNVVGLSVSNKRSYK